MKLNPLTILLKKKLLNMYLITAQPKHNLSYGWPPKFLNTKKHTKLSNALFREFLFQSEWFCTSGVLPIAIKTAIQNYNSRNNRTSKTNINRQEQATLNRFIQPPHDLTLTIPNSVQGQAIIKTNDHTLTELKTQLTNLLQSNLSLEEKKKNSTSFKFKHPIAALQTLLSFLVFHI